MVKERPAGGDGGGRATAGTVRHMPLAGIAQEAWNAPGWKEAAREYHANRRPTKLTRREWRRWQHESNAPHALDCACWCCILESLREVALSQHLYRPARQPMVRP